MTEEIKKWKQPEKQSQIGDVPQSKPVAKANDPEVFGKPASSFAATNEPVKKEEVVTPKEDNKKEKKESKRDKMLKDANAAAAEKKPLVDPIAMKAEAESKALMIKTEAEVAAARLKAENDFLMETPEGRQLLLQERIFKQRLAMAQKFFLAGCFTSDVHNAEQAFVKIQAGAEMGMEPMRAMNGLYMVNGKVTIWGQETSRRLKDHGWDLEYVNETDDGVTVKITNKKTGITHQEVVKRGETQLKNSKAMGFAPKNKMRWYGLAQLVRFKAPEVLNGLDVTENIIDMPPIEEQVAAATLDQGLAKKEEMRKNRNVIDNTPANAQQ